MRKKCNMKCQQTIMVKVRMGEWVRGRLKEREDKKNYAQIAWIWSKKCLNSNTLQFQPYDFRSKWELGPSLTWRARKIQKYLAQVQWLHNRIAFHFQLHWICHFLLYDTVFHFGVVSTKRNQLLFKPKMGRFQPNVAMSHTNLPACFLYCLF